MPSGFQAWRGGMGFCTWRRENISLCLANELPSHAISCNSHHRTIEVWRSQQKQLKKIAYTNKFFRLLNNWAISTRTGDGGGTCVYVPSSQALLSVWSSQTYMLVQHPLHNRGGTSLSGIPLSCRNGPYEPLGILGIIENNKWANTMKIS